MNRPKLKNIYKNIISERVAMVTSKAGTAAVDFTNNTELDKLKRDSNVSSIVGTDGQKLKETEIDEMANVAVRYQLAPDVNAADYAGKKARIIAAMQDSGEAMSKPEVAAAMGYDKQNPINSDFMALVADGTIVAAGEQRAPRLNRPTAEPTVGDEEGDEEEVPSEEDDLGITNRDLSDEEIDAMFAKAKASGEDEPEITGGSSIPTDVKGAKAKAVDFFIDDDNARAFQKMVSAFSTSKIKIREASAGEDISSSDFTSAEKSRKVKATSSVDTLVQQYADRIRAASEGDKEVEAEILNMLAKKLESVGYNMLFKKITKILNANVEIVPEPDEHDQEVLDTLDDDEMLKEVFMKRAGLIK